MLSKAQRLSKKEFDVLWSTGERAHTPLFSFIYKKTESTPKFSVTVSKKVAPSAPARNKIRRIGYEALAKVLKEKEVVVRGIILIHHTDVTVDTLTQELLRVL